MDNNTHPDVVAIRDAEKHLNELMRIWIPGNVAPDVAKTIGKLKSAREHIVEVYDMIDRAGTSLS